jgi:hypothetical protein
MNQNTEQLKNWFGRVRRILKKASVALDDKQPRWCPASGEGTQMEFQFGDPPKVANGIPQRF